MENDKKMWAFVSGVVAIVLVATFGLAPLMNGKLTTETTTIFSGQVVNALNSYRGGTHTVGASEVIAVAYHMDEGTSTGHVDLEFEISFDNRYTDKADVTNWITGDAKLASDYQADDTWQYAALPATNTRTRWIRYKLTGVTGNATDTTFSVIENRR